MYGGKAEQVGTPFEIYNRPATKFVANFVGTLNVLEGKVTDAASGKVQVNTQEVSLKGKLNGSKSGDTLSLALRPEAISLGRQPGRDSSLSGEISEVHFLGSVIRVRVGIGGNTVSLDTFNSPPPRRPLSARRPRFRSRRATCWCCIEVDAGRQPQAGAMNGCEICLKDRPRLRCAAACAPSAGNRPATPGRDAPR